MKKAITPVENWPMQRLTIRISPVKLTQGTTSILASSLRGATHVYYSSMEDFAELMQRLLEIQSGGRQRSPELIAEDERLMDALHKIDPFKKTAPQRMPKTDG
jgi:hypothetical protein